MERLPIILHNIACYLDCLPLEAGLGPGAATWSGLLTQFDGLFRRLVLMLSSIEDSLPLLRIMISVLKVPGIQQSKVILYHAGCIYESEKNFIMSCLILGTVGSIFKSIKLCYTEFNIEVQLFDRFVLSLPQRIYSR